MHVQQATGFAGGQTDWTSNVRCSPPDSIRMEAIDLAVPRDSLRLDRLNSSAAGGPDTASSVSSPRSVATPVKESDQCCLHGRQVFRA